MQKLFGQYLHTYSYPKYVELKFWISKYLFMSVSNCLGGKSQLTLGLRTDCYFLLV